MVDYRISMKKFAEILLKRRENNYDVMIIVDGPRGNGKSTFLYKLFPYLGQFIPERDIVFSREDLIDRMKERFGLIMQDEMINAAHNRDFYEKDQKMLIKILNMYRDNYNIVGGCVPFFYDLDPQFRKFIKIRVTIPRRGVAIIQTARASMFTNDPWETDTNRKIEMVMQERAKKGRKTNINFSKLTTFYGVLNYGALTPKQEARYHKIKAAKRNKLMEDQEPDKEEKENPIAILLEKLDSKEITHEHIRTYCTLTNKNYNNFLRDMSRYRTNKPSLKVIT